MAASDGRILSFRKLTLALCLAAALLLAALYVQAAYLFAPPTRITAAANKTTDLMLPQLPHLTRWPLLDPSTDADIDLFVASAIATAPVVQQAPQASDPADEAPISLTAVVVTAAERRALIEVGTARELVSAREGTLIQGWQIILIESDQVTFERGDARKVIYLRDIVVGGQ